MGRPNRDYIRVCAFLPAHDLTVLDELAIASGRNRSDMLRRVVRAGLPIIEHRIAFANEHGLGISR